MSKTVITYKKEELGVRLETIIELKNNLGYDLRGLTEALGYTDTEIIRKVLLKELPIIDDMYLRARALLELNRIQPVKGREAELRSRINLLNRLTKKITAEGVAKRINKPVKYVTNFNTTGKLIGDQLYKKLFDILAEIEELEAQERERKRLARIYPIEEIIEDMEREVEELEPQNKAQETEEELEHRMRKKRLLNRLKRLQIDGVKEVTPHSSGYRAV